MPLRNPRFDEPGAHPGEAAHWTVTVVAPQLVCGFGSPQRGTEDFDRWFERLRRLDEAPTVRAFFETQPSERFERWMLGPYLRVLPPARLLPAALGPRATEAWEQGWFVGAFLRHWELVAAAPADFGQGPEHFGWQAVARDWSHVSSASALFSQGAHPVEAFADPW